MLFDFLSLDFDGVVEFSFQMFDKVCGPERTTASQRTSQYPIVTTSQRHNDQRPPPLRLQDKDESLSTDELKTIVKSTASKKDQKSGKSDWEAKADKLLGKLDRNGDGTINLYEFRQAEKESPTIFLDIQKLQDKLRTKIVSPKFWKEKERLRRTALKGADLPAGSPAAVYNKAKAGSAGKKLGSAVKGQIVIDKSKVAPQATKAEVEAARDAEDAAREAKLQERYEAQMAQYLADDDEGE